MFFLPLLVQLSQEVATFTIFILNVYVFSVDVSHLNLCHYLYTHFMFDVETVKLSCCEYFSVLV